MGAIPDSVLEKVSRARHHFDSLNREMNTFMQDDPDATLGFVIQQDSDRGENIVRWGKHTAPPLRWSVVLGEFFYDLRSALDHLARHLILANERTPYHSEFPVFQKELKFDDRDPRSTKGMSDEAIAVIKALQPFSEWPEHPKQTTLWRIHDLCNIDKHNLLHLSDFFLVSALVDFRMLLPYQLPQPVFTEEFVAERIWLKPNAKIAHHTWDPSALRRLGDAQVQMQVKLSLDISLSEWKGVDGDGHPAEGMPVDHAMQVALDYMETTLLPKFEQFF